MSENKYKKVAPKVSKPSSSFTLKIGNAVASVKLGK